MICPKSYTPKFLAEKILTSRSTIEGEHKLVTVLFADVADFTSMAEKLGPEETHQIMDGCFQILLEEFYEILAYHFVQAEVWDRAMIYLRDAGQRAINKSAYMEAITNLNNALVVLQKLPESAERVELELALQLDLAQSLIVPKGWTAPEVEKAYARAYELCQQVGQTPKLTPVLQGLRLVYAGRAERGDAQKALGLGTGHARTHARRAVSDARVYGKPVC